MRDPETVSVIIYYFLFILLLNNIFLGQKFALMEEKTVLSTIIRKYKIKSAEKPENIKYYPELVLKSQTGIKMTMKPRK